MGENVFRQYAREAMEMSHAATTKAEERLYAGLACTWALAALLEERRGRPRGPRMELADLPVH